MTPEEKKVIEDAAEKAAEEGIENKRQAVNMAAGLSGQLITAALGMIALQGAYVAFAADKKQCGEGFWFLMLVAFLSFVASVVCAGKATARLYKNGAVGNWDPLAGKSLFSLQAISCFLGILLFIFAVFAARQDKTPDADMKAQVGELTQEVGQLQKQIQQFRSLTNIENISTLATKTSQGKK